MNLLLILISVLSAAAAMPLIVVMPFRRFCLAILDGFLDGFSVRGDFSARVGFAFHGGYVHSIFVGLFIVAVKEDTIGKKKRHNSSKDFLTNMYLRN